jgi:hypothetical protein
VFDLVADGSSAAFAWDGYSIDAWNVRTGRRERDVGGADTGIGGLATAGGTVGYVGEEETNELDYQFVAAQPLGSGPAFERRVEGASTGGIGYVAGHGDVLVFNTWLPHERGSGSAVLWRIVGKRAVPIMRGSESLFAADVDGGRILLRNPPRDVEVVSATGSILARYRFARPVGAVRLDGESLAARLPGSIVVRDLSTGALLRSWKVPGQARLEDISGGLVVYLVGRQIHLRRIGNGRDRVVPLPAGAREPVLAQLEAPGLVYSWAARVDSDGVVTESRVAFAPLKRVEALFGG